MSSSLQHCVVVCKSGRNNILPVAALLENLTERWEQPAAMHWLECFLNKTRLRWKKPVLVLLVRSDANVAELSVETVLGAALFFEYKVLGIGSGFFMTDDSSALHTVAGPADQRSEIARIAAEALMARGAQLVSCLYDAGSGRDAQEMRFDPKRVRWARLARSAPRDLPLLETYDLTLGQLGKTTRRNMRYYRKNLSKKVEVEFVAEAAPLLSIEEISALNRQALNPVDEGLALSRFMQAKDHPQGFLVGLKTSDGQWLSLIGGWHEGDVAVLNWQVNAAGYEKDSISTVMRAYYLEHEVERGSRLLMFDGGTPTSLGNSLLKTPVHDLIVQRLSLRAKFIVFARTAFGSAEFAMPALYSLGSDWNAGGATPQEAEWNAAEVMAQGQ